MSFFFDTIEIPFWFIVFVFSSAAPLWIKWARKFNNKFIVTGLLARRLKKAKSAAETKMDIFNKATNYWNETGEFSDFENSTVKKRKSPKKEIDPIKKQNIQIVLKMLAEAGETGILAKSISDKTKIPTLETTNALTYITQKEYAEIINSSAGKKYYLTDLGRRYCINKQFI